MQSVTLTTAHRRLLNYLANYPDTLTRYVLGDVECGVEELDPLARAGLVEADDDDGVVNILTSQSEVLLKKWLHLTVEGQTWVNTDPENLFLRVLDAACYQDGKLQLRKAIKAAGQDRVVTTVEAGYATVHFDENEVRVPPIAAFAIRRLVAGADTRLYALIVTSKIRRVLGPR